MKDFDTSKYDDFPITVLIYEVVYDEDGAFADYRIAYGNKRFADDYKAIYHRDVFLGASAIKDHLVDEYTLQRMGELRCGNPQSFSTYVAHAGLHIHMSPLVNLPEGYIGYIIGASVQLRRILHQYTGYSGTPGFLGGYIQDSDGGGFGRYGNRRGKGC